jgi:hypothetical protein
MKNGHGGWLLVAFGAFGALGAVAAQSPSPPARHDPRAIAVLDAARAATGGAAWAGVHSVRYRATVASGAHQGVAETLEDTRTGRYVDRYVVGEVRGGQGFDGTAPWTSDVRGREASAGAAEGEAASVTEVYRRSLSYWFRDRHPGALDYLGRTSAAGREFDRIGVLPTGGRPFEMWVDTRSHWISRVLEVESGVQRVTQFDDYRRVAGLFMPFAARTSVGAPELDTVVKFIAIDINPPLAADAFARPAAIDP